MYLWGVVSFNGSGINEFMLHFKLNLLDLLAFLPSLWILGLQGLKLSLLCVQEFLV